MTWRGNGTNKSRSSEFVAASVGNRQLRAAWPIWTRFFGFAICSAAAAAAPATDKDPWGDAAVGERQARQAISQCLYRADKTPGMLPEHCVEAVYQACEKAHGNMSQRDMNECAAFSQKSMGGPARGHKAGSAEGHERGRTRRYKCQPAQTTQRERAAMG